MTSNLGYSAVLKPNEGVVVVIDGRSFPVPPSAINYKPLVDALRDQQPADVIRSMITPKRVLQTIAKDAGFEVVVEEATDTIEVWCDGKQLHGMIADRIVELVEKKENFTALQHFVQKASQNRDPDAIDQLYVFIEANRCQLHPDGDVLCFKAVRDDYRDHHSGTVHYQLGSHVTKERRDCDPDPMRDCSNGLHVGGRRYVETFYRGSGTRILIIKVNPKDFVSVPAYDHGKARVCDLYVYAEIPRSDMESSLTAFAGIIPAGESLLGAPTRKPVFDATPLQSERPKARPKTAQFTLVHVGTGKRVQLKALQSLVGKVGQRQASKALGIPRTTIQDWLRSHAL